MRLVLLAALVMVAFAANSLLNRAAVGGGLIEALPFSLLRVAAGALALGLLAGGRPGRTNLLPAFWLASYLIGFSLAYQQLDSGIGALLLFATVQVTMLAGGAMSGESLPPRRLVGAALALAGLGALLLPGTGAVPAPGPALLMVAAGLGWGLYSLAGRRARDPLRASAANFLLATPLVALVTLPMGLDLGHPTIAGVLLALVSGAVTSGLAYALWYAILPRLGAARAAVAQLSVPVLAIVAGAILLAEPLTLPAVLAAAVVMVGVALASLPARSPR